MNPGTFCATCGSVIKQGALYCGTCGAPTAAQAPATPVPPPTVIGTIGDGAGSPTVGDVAAPPAPGPAGCPGYASFGRRVAAYLLDAVVPALSVTVGCLALFTAAGGDPRPVPWLAVGLLGVVPLAYFVVLWVMAAGGNSPGNALLGIRVVRESTGGKPGAGLGLGRLLLKGLLIGLTMFIGGFSPLWDRGGRRKGWWDSACGTVVLNRDAVADHRSAVSTAQTPSLAAMSLGGLPVAEPAADDGPTGFERPAWDVPPVAAPAPRPVAAPVPAASWGDRPADRAGKPTVGPDPTQDMPWEAQVATSGVIRSVPGAAVPAAESVEHTRLKVTRDRPTDVQGWLAELDDGRTLPLAGPVILGRDPSARPDESAAGTVPITDEGCSVSKTHLRLDVGAGGVQVTDRHSTNGVVVVTAGVDLPCVPGVATPVPDGSTVRFGDRSLLVRRA